MNVNELRMGNWVYYPHTVKEYYLVDRPNAIGMASILIPIPLTDELLSKCGFTKSSSLSELWTFGNTMLIWRTEYESEEFDNYYEFRFGITDSYKAYRQVRLDYLHQLQNLTFALTGEELIIELWP